MAKYRKIADLNKKPFDLHKSQYSFNKEGNYIEKDLDAVRRLAKRNITAILKKKADSILPYVQEDNSKDNSDGGNKYPYKGHTIKTYHDIYENYMDSWAYEVFAEDNDVLYDEGGFNTEQEAIDEAHKAIDEALEGSELEEDAEIDKDIEENSNKLTWNDIFMNAPSSGSGDGFGTEVIEAYMNFYQKANASNFNSVEDILDALYDFVDNTDSISKAAENFIKYIEDSEAEPQ